MSGDNLLKYFIEYTKNNSIMKQEGHISIAILGSVADVIQSKHLSKYYNIDFGNILLIQKKKRGAMYFPTESYKKFSKITFDKALKLDDIKDLQEYKDYLQIKDKIEKLYNNPKKNLPLQDLYTYIDELFKIEYDVLLSTLFCESMDHDLGMEIAKSVGVKDGKDFINKASLSTFESFMIWQDRLLVDGKEDRWMLADYYGVPSTSNAKDFFQKQIKEKGGFDKIMEKIKQSKKQITENIKKVEKFKETLTDINQRKLVEYIQLSMDLRDSRKESIQKIIVLIVDALTKLSKIKGLTYDEISRVHCSELRKLEDSDFKNEIIKRENGAIQLSGESSSEIDYIDFDDARDILNKTLIDKEIDDTVKGVTANTGKAIGSVRIILGEDMFHTFNDGDILVTSMTRAEFVPLMRKASAIVTDEGGITCHAAIISRELKIPCIIGTKIATIKLKDGDLVEVDADKGVVRILNNKHE